MKTTTIFLLASFFCTYNLFAQKPKGNSNYVIPLKGDTIYCEEVSTTIMGGYTCKLLNGKTENYKAKELLGLNGEIALGLLEKAQNRTYERKLFKPDKKDKDKTELLELLIQDGEAKLYRYLQAGDGQYGGGVLIYYLYNADKFVDYIDKKNYEQVLTKYFKNCDYFKTKLKDIRFAKLSELAIESYKKCK